MREMFASVEMFAEVEELLIEVCWVNNLGVKHDVDNIGEKKREEIQNFDMNILPFKSSKGVGTMSPWLSECVSSILFLRLLTLMTSQVRNHQISFFS